MGEQLDYTTLTWVKDEIQESLNQTHQALEAFIEDTSDTTQIRFCATYLHQIYGTLQMVEIYGAALLAEEMEKVANALLNGKITQQQDAFEVLIRATLQLPAYLERLENGHPDLPAVLTPLLNDMRAARGEPLLSENAFFSPDLEILPPEKRLVPGKNYPEIQDYAKKLRPIYQFSLLGVLRDKDPAGSLKKMAAVLRELQNTCHSIAAQRLWWVVGGIVESLIDKGLQNSSALKMLLGQVDREIKRLIKNGESAIDTAESSDLIKNCLYYTATATSTGPRVTTLKQVFSLEKLLPYSGSMEQAADELKGSTADIMDSVSAVLKDDLLHVKDRLDIFVRNTEREISELSPLAENLARTADTLAMLSLGDLRRVIQGQVTHLQQLVENGEDPADADLMEVASALLYVESSLDHLKETKQTHAETDAPDLTVNDDTDSPEVLLPRTEQIQITNLVIKEAKSVLADVKEGFNTFAVEPNQFDVIAEVPAKLAQIQGALAVMNLEHAAKLLGAANAFIREDVIAAQVHPDSAKLDNLADAITSIEYYLEAIEEGRGQPESVLAVAEISVEQLGHPVESVSALINVETDVVPTEDKPSGSVSSPSLESETAISDDPNQTQKLVMDASFSNVSSETTQEIITPGKFESESSVATEEALTEVEEYQEENIDEEILEIFVEEADEVLGTMTDCLHAWRANNDDTKSLETLRRSYHTIKGSGRLAGAMVMGDFSWSIESLLNRVLDNKVAPNPGMFTLLDKAETVVRGLLAHLKKETDVRPPVKALAAQADAMSNGSEFNVNDIVSVSIPTAMSTPGDIGVSPSEIEAVPSVQDEELSRFDQGIVPEEDLLATLDLSLEDENQSFDVSVSPEDDAFISEEMPAVDDALSLESSISELEDIALELIPSAELDEAFTEEPEVAPTREPALVEVFQKETATHISAIREFLSNAGGNEAVVDDDLHRALHTLHGSARMADVISISELSEPMDRLIRAMHERALPLDSTGQNLLRQIADATETIAAAFADTAFIAPDQSDLLNQIAALHEAVLATSAPETPNLDDFVAAAAALNDTDDEDAELIAIFTEEADEILASTDGLMQQWASSNDSDHAVLTELQRALHTLKGGARLANIFAIGDLAHDLESVLENITEHHSPAAEGLPELVQQGLDWLVLAIQQVRNGDIPEDPSELRAQIIRLATTAETGESKSIQEGSDTLVIDEPVVDKSDAEESIINETSDDDLLPEEESINELMLSTDDTSPEELPESAFEELVDEAADVNIASTEPKVVSAAVDVDYDPDLLEVFLEEADELQEGTENALQKWATQHDQLDHVAELQRLLHTLKGGARMANVLAVGDLAHAMESLLERIADGRIEPLSAHIDVIQSCHDWLITGLEAARKLQPTSIPAGLLAQLDAAISGKPFDGSVTAEASPTAEADVETKIKTETDLPETPAAPTTPATTAEEMEELTESISLDQVGEKTEATKKVATSDEQVRVRADLLNNLVNYSGEINIYNSRITQQLGASRFNLAELDQTVLRLREQLRKFEIETETQIMYRHETTSTDTEDFDPLEMDRFSTMQQLSRGMVESLGDLTSIQALLDNLSSETDVLLLQQQRVTSELQEGLMRTRMISFSSVLPRLRRIMRQTCKEIGKDADLRVTGDEGEIDRTQLNRIVPALEHILRNAIGHGLEMPDDRAKAGKSVKGNVHIAFTHEGSEVVLAISDDGAGINLEALRKKAIEKGRMLADANLSDSEIMKFILEPGFSTAEEVTQVSGRGVGLDVVNTEVKQLGGTLHIDSEAGKSTTFTLRLPLTVLVNQALMVQVADATYAIQLPNIEHVVRVGSDELVPLIANEKTYFEYAGQRYQYLNLGTVLQGTTPQLPAKRQRVPLMLIRVAEHRIALHVDSLLGRQEIVIKSVGPQLSTVGVLSGATILPDGQVALILDIGNLVRSALAQQHGQAVPLMPSIEEAAAAEKQMPTVMIVDDSITVRKVTERLLKRYDYNIITAKDGVDALTVMLEQTPDIMLLDVEMPRMDGYELATTMRNDERLKTIPIIMITSRTGDKHRQRAFNIGVNQYMGKPYQEQELIENIRTLIDVKQH